jgi:hypothetical protein
MIRSTLLAFALAVLAPGLAWAEPAKPETIAEMLVVTKAQSMIESVYKNVDDMMKGALDQAMAEAPGDTDDKRAFAESVSRKMVAIMREEMSWETMRPMYQRIYGDSFTQEELLGVLDFYKTPAGQAMIDKMPVVMQKTMAEMQQRMGPMMQRLQRAMQESVEEAKAKQAAAKPAPTPKTVPQKEPAAK